MDSDSVSDDLSVDNLKEEDFDADVEIADYHSLQTELVVHRISVFLTMLIVYHHQHHTGITI